MTYTKLVFAERVNMIQQNLQKKLTEKKIYVHYHLVFQTGTKQESYTVCGHQYITLVQ